MLVVVLLLQPPWAGRAFEILLLDRKSSFRCTKSVRFSMRFILLKERSNTLCAQPYAYTHVSISI